MCIHTFMYVCICVCMYACMCVYIFICLYVYTLCVWLCVFIILMSKLYLIFISIATNYITIKLMYEIIMIIQLLGLHWIVTSYHYIFNYSFGRRYSKACEHGLCHKLFHFEPRLNASHYS